MCDPLPGEEAVPDCRRRRPGDGSVTRAHAPRQHAHRRRRLLLQGLRRGAGDHPLHAERECRAQSHRDGDRAEEQACSGQTS
jgi:hypothetical protein